MADEQDLRAELPPISDEEAELRLRNYNPNGVFGRALNYAWRMAGPIIIDTHRQVSAEIIQRAPAGTAREKLIRYTTDVILKEGLQSVQACYKMPCDIDWVRRIAAAAVVLHRQAVTPPSLIRGKTEITKRTVIRIHDEFNDSTIAIQVSNTLWTLLVYESEILLWKLNELYRAG